MRKSIVGFVVFFLSACSALPASPAEPSEIIPILPSATPTGLPTATSTDIPPTASPEPIADPSFFRDDFIETLDTHWSWVREDPLNWSLTSSPGALQINVDYGFVAMHNNSNLLLRTAPTGNFQIETQVSHRPRENFQFAGLIIYEDDSNFVQAGREFCRSEGCIGEGLYMHYYDDGTAVQPHFGQSYKSIHPIRLRLSRKDNTFTFEASTDGKIWFLIGTHVGDLQPTQIGLVTGQRMEGDNIPAVFEYFEVRSLP